MGFVIENWLMAATATSQANVAVVDNAFHPAHLNITTGIMVIWTYSTGSSLHTVTSIDNTTQGGSPLLNSGTLNPGQSYTYTFYEPGFYPYQCGYHLAAMTGWVNVTGAPVQPPSTQNPPSYFTLVAIGAGVATAVIVGTLALFVRKKKRGISGPTLPKTPNLSKPGL